MSVLELLKLDLCLSSTARDTYLQALIDSAKQELNSRAVEIDETKLEDKMLLSDYCAWKYRTRDKTQILPNNLKLRINNKKIRNRLNSNG